MVLYSQDRQKNNSSHLRLLDAVKTQKYEIDFPLSKKIVYMYFLNKDPNSNNQIWAIFL